MPRPVEPHQKSKVLHHITSLISMGLDKLHVLRAIPFTTEYLKELKGTTKPFFQRRAPADQKNLRSDMFRSTLKTSIEHGSGMEKGY